MITPPNEKIGSFYLGAEYDIHKKEILNNTINYDARDLTTHAVCVGMTGSGKTGLCIGLLEEAAIDKIPAIIIDPKGDMTNLLLQFEGLVPEDFKPWLNADDAARKGMSVDEYAESTSKLWQNGLADWGQNKERIKALKDSVDYTIYTPGSNAGVPINIMGSFAAPGIDFDSEAEMLRERIQGTVAALLGMIGSKEDPSRSREGILLTNLFEHHWRNNEDLDLGGIIRGIQNPPMKQLGVFDVETFYPQKDRFQLAMDFNTLVASPQFSYWLQGEALDIEKIYFTPEGKPRHAIFYIAHLSDSERMFFVTLLLNSVVTWMRKQSGTSSLRSLLYFDEIFGYFPPTAQPPSKKPLLTILKQARAFGVGAVLVTQNPVDIDYKGLSNAGTWFIGKLQTERDKMRVLDGLTGAIAESGNSNETNFDQLISSLGSRVFLMHNVHEKEPVVYHTRWAMSYLRGPLTRPQIKTLMEDKKKMVTKNPMVPKSASEAPSVKESSTKAWTNEAPAIDPKIEQRFISVWKSASEVGVRGSSAELVYEPNFIALSKVRFYDAKNNIDQIKEINLLCPPPDDFGRVSWDQTKELSNWEQAVCDSSDAPNDLNIQYEDIPDSADTSKELNALKKEFTNWLYQEQKLEKLYHPSLKLTQAQTESKEAFHMRIQQIARERRDEEIDELQDKYEVKIDRIEDKMRKEEQDIANAEADLSSRKTAEFLGMAETAFAIFSGRRRSLSSATSKSRMRRKASDKLRQSEDDLKALNEDLREIDLELKDKINEITNEWDNAIDQLEIKHISPRKSDIKVDGVMLVWHPFWQDADGNKASAMR